MPRRAPETLVDWLVVGIAPFLIMLLVGSLVFYLVEVFYLGDYQLRLLFVMAMFVMAIVCIARISMEAGAAYASLYAVPLAGAVGLAVAMLVEVRGPLASLGPGLNWMLMAIVWWSAHKLTWDCTLIDGGRDFTGQGLMQTTGLERFFKIKTPNQHAEPSKVETLQPEPTPRELSGTSSTDPAKPLPIWEWWLRSEQRPHAPGVWVVYFSLAALPLFGLGQWFIPESNEPLRRRAFWLLVVYVAAGLSLLMATSFLSLRRYLRQRNQEMPNDMAGVWLSTGAVMVVVLLILAALLPRPAPEYSITHLATKFDSSPQNASRWGWGKEGAKSKPGASHTATQGEASRHRPPTGSQGSPAQQSSTPGSKPGSGQSSSNSGSGSQSGNKSSGSNSQQGQNSQSGSQNGQSNQSGNGPSNSPNNSAQNRPTQQNNSGQNSHTQQGQSPQTNSQPSNSPQSSSPQPNSSGSPQNSSQSNPQSQANNSQGNQPDTQQSQQLPSETAPPQYNHIVSQGFGQLFAYFLHVLKWLGYLIVGAIIAYYAWKHREWLLAAWQQLLQELRELWERWFGPKSATAPVAVGPAPPPARRFADYPDPFSSGLAARWSLAELVQYTFAALEARGRERDCPRGTEQTPLEYAAAVGQIEPAFASDFRSLADLYGQLAFAGGHASPQAQSLLQQLWQRWK